MVEPTYSKSELINLIDELVPSYQREYVTQFANLDDVSIETLERAGTQLLGEAEPVGFVVHVKNGTGINANSSPIWACIKGEVQELFCTESDKYAAERKEGRESVKNLVTIVATAVAAQFSLPLGVIVGAVTVCFMCALKLGVSAFCKARTVA